MFKNIISNFDDCDIFIDAFPIAPSIPDINFYDDPELQFECQKEEIKKLRKSIELERIIMFKYNRALIKKQMKKERI